MIISIDTGILYTMAYYADKSKTELEKCIQHQTAICLHEDWSCAEKDIINERLSKIKVKQKLLADRMSEYSAGMKKVAVTLENKEKAIPGLFQEVDNAISSALSQSPESQKDTSSALFDITSVLSESITMDNRIQNYEFSNINSDICICEFDSFSLD